MEKIGTVTESEKSVIYDLFEKSNALINLKKIVSLDDVNCVKIINELCENEKAQELWWQAMGRKYEWTAIEGRSWKINFSTNEIFLI